jgi:cation diffusion facilitator CzcD-associated flavoprotein CzcO
MSTEQSTEQPMYEAVIVGTGFGGMGAAIQLKRMGIDKILMLDRESDLGGTWQINRYPGLAVDIASVSYSYSFEPNPYWSHRYCAGPEIKAYADHVASKYDLRRYMRFNTPVERAEFNEAGQYWTIHAAGLGRVTTRLLILATGLLSQPQYPDIKGVKSFAGKVLHTAAWDHDYHFAGKRAAIIGTGASAVQVLPVVAEQAAKMSVFQRTAIWVYPKKNPRIPASRQQLYARFPWVQRTVRFFSDLMLETLMVTAILHARQIPFLVRMAENACRKHLERQVPDPELRRKLTPTYSFGCKRPTFSNDYFPTFNRPNVELVTEAIDRIEEDAVVTRDGRRHEIDALILATGFNLWQKGNFPAFEVVGSNGIEMGHKWRSGSYRSFEGLTVPGFPNLFNLHSPYSYTGFCYFNAIEIQMRHIERCLREMRRRGAKRFEVTEEAEQGFMRQMQQSAPNTVLFAGNCASANSYYFNPHGEASLLRLTSTRAGMAAAMRFPMSAYTFS